jgi:hypothetical protein
MADVSFEEENIVPSHSYGPSRSVGLAERLVAWSIVKTARQGEIVLLSTAVIAAILAVFVFFSANAGSAKPETPTSKTWPR